MTDDTYTHRKEVYGFRGASTSQGDSLCAGSVARRPGMASHRSITTGTTTPAAGQRPASGGTARDARERPGGGLLKRAALYARVSTDKQEREETVASPVDLLPQAAAAHGSAVLPGKVCIAAGISGTRLNRPALERLRNRVAAGAFEVVRGTAPDCLARR